VSSSTSNLERSTRVVIVGGGFAGLNAAKLLGNRDRVEVTLLDRRNHHVFQPLLYQVAMAGLSPADIAAPIRGMLSKYRNIRVLQGEVTAIDLPTSTVRTDFGAFPYDYLLLACGAQHSYFGHDEWEQFAPGLKTLEQATEIRRRVLTAFETAERLDNPHEQRKFLTFVVVGGGPTGVELAGAIGEMSRFTLAKDFRHIDSTLSRVLLLEAGPRILPSFSAEQASRATRDLENLGVQVWTSSLVTNIDADGVEVGEERVRAATVLWAAGVKASPIGKALGSQLDRQGRVLVEPDLTIEGHSRVFVAGDMAHCARPPGPPLPGIAPVAIQQGRYIAKTILNDLEGKPRQPFQFVDKGQMATIGRSRAIAHIGWLKVNGFAAWLIWLVVHIYYLTGFKNRLFVVMQWAWSYMTFRRGARLIVNKEWRQELPASDAATAGAATSEPVPVERLKR
jgi:NADH dehydrogenase